MSRRKKRTQHRSETKKELTGWAVAGVLLLAAGGGGWAWMSSTSSKAADIEVYKSPTCGCCSGWIAHMRRNGFTVKAKNVEDLDAIKRMAGVDDDLESCHTAFVSGYAIEGHVPADSVKRLLSEKPAVRGLAVPGMPGGSPGMEGADREKFDVLIFKSDGSRKIYRRY
ncbi:MAG: DUF411 domain-containing protein [Rhodospirillales bacterium]|nr:DUF411 domain-containing protein [Rhodospirillales bacterium]